MIYGSTPSLAANKASGGHRRVKNAALHGESGFGAHRQAIPMGSNGFQSMMQKFDKPEGHALKYGSYVGGGGIEHRLKCGSVSVSEHNFSKARPKASSDIHQGGGQGIPFGVAVVNRGLDRNPQSAHGGILESIL